MRVGDKVTLKLDSQWVKRWDTIKDDLRIDNPVGVIGVITDILPFDPDDLRINVTWASFQETGKPITNSYAEYDLDVIECADCKAVQEAEQNPHTECDQCGWEILK